MSNGFLDFASGATSGSQSTAAGTTSGAASSAQQAGQVATAAGLATGIVPLAAAGAVLQLGSGIISARANRRKRRLQKRLERLRRAAQLDRLQASEDFLRESRATSEPFSQQALSGRGLGRSSRAQRVQQIGTAAFQRRIQEIERQRDLVRQGANIADSIERIDRETERSLIALDFLNQGAVGTTASLIELQGRS